MIRIFLRTLLGDVLILRIDRFNFCSLAAAIRIASKCGGIQRVSAHVVSTDPAG